MMRLSLGTTDEQARESTDDDAHTVLQLLGGMIQGGAEMDSNLRRNLPIQVGGNLRRGQPVREGPPPAHSAVRLDAPLEGANLPAVLDTGAIRRLAGGELVLRASALQCNRSPSGPTLNWVDRKQLSFTRRVYVPVMDPADSTCAVATYFSVL